MKKNEVPQDKGQLETAKMTEKLYVLDEDGNYTTAQSRGWDAKSLALDESMELINERVENARKAVAEGKASPILYFMELNKMDWQVLAGYVGFWQWRVKKHAKPAVFKKLDEKKLKKYADAFEISIEELKNFEGK